MKRIFRKLIKYITVKIDSILFGKIQEVSFILEGYLFWCDQPLVSTFSNDLVQERTMMNSSWRVLDRVMVNVLPLSEILDRYLPQKQKIDFMTIDVEGLDLEVLESNDWSLYRVTYVFRDAHGK